MSWTKINKPTGTSYTNVNPQGREQYDQGSLMYDDSSTYYDGINTSQWTDVPKPTDSSATATPGLYYGFGAFTYSGGQILSTGGWTKVAKPN